MTKKQARKWLKAFKESRFKCIAPTQVIEAMRVLGVVKPATNPTWQQQ